MMSSVSDIGGVGDFSDFGESSLSDISHYVWRKPLDGAVSSLYLDKFICPLTSMFHTSSFWRV